MGRDGSTGRAVFTRGEERVVFVVERGVLVDLEAPGDASVSDILIRSGKLQRETYEALVIPAGEDRFAVATASGVVSRREAAWGRKLSAIESLARLLSWTEGEYTFDPLAPESPAGFRLPIDKWILELFLRSNDRALVVSKVGPTDLPLRKAEGFAPSFAALGLTADADAVASLVDGHRSVEEIVRKSKADEFAVLKLLAALIALGLVRPSYEAPFPEPHPAEPELAEPEPPIALEEPVVPAPAEPDPFEIEPAPAEAPAAESPAEPISLPLFALTAPEEPAEIAAAASLDPEPGVAPIEPETPARSGGRRGLWAALAFAAAGAAAFWAVSRRPTESPAAAPKTREAPARPAAASEPPGTTARPDARPAAPPREPPPARKAAAAAVPQAATRPPSAQPKSRQEPAPWKRALEKSRRAFEHPGEYAYAIQLELACEESTVAKALRADPSGRQIWIVPFDFRGRSCYRVLWGRYRTLPKARDAKASVPAMFLRGGNRPAVVSLGSAEGSGKAR